MKFCFKQTSALNSDQVVTDKYLVVIIDNDNPNLMMAGGIASRMFQNGQPSERSVHASQTPVIYPDRVVKRIQ